jgi:hypothetical protein
MNNSPNIFGINSYHNFDSRLLFVTDNIPFLEWLRQAAPEYELRIISNLTTLDGWCDIDNFNCSKFKVFDSRLDEQPTTDDSITKMNELCRSWADVYFVVVGMINKRRRHLSSAHNFIFQSVIYQEKFKEAQDVLDGKFSNLKFLNNEANYKNISLTELASQVMLEHDMYIGYLARTEFLRIKWLDKLKLSRNITDHKVIRKEFIRELHEYHLLS